MTRIDQVVAWEALDSRGRPTVACRVTVSGGSSGRAVVPSGASTGSYEAVELRDGGHRYGGKGVRRAVEQVNTVLADAVRGLDTAEPDAVDLLLEELDGSSRYARLGGNAVLAVSVAAARAGATAAGMSLARWLHGPGALPLPMPMINVISGGAHAGRAIDVQDLLVIPLGAAGFTEALEWCARVREEARRLALAAGHGAAVLVADEGGLGVPLGGNAEALDLLVRAIESAGFTPGTDVAVAIDVAANQLWTGDGYELGSEGRTLATAELVDEIAGWVARHPVVSVEDPLHEDDWDGWAAGTRRLAGVQVIGDDLFATDPSRLAEGVRRGAANAVLVKVNQNGTLRGARGVLDDAQRAGWATVVSARSGDTEDDWLADLAVGWRAGQIKVGSVHRSERCAKWNRLLELEATEDTTFTNPWREAAV
ncbi:phosphopyruvate hydratase [Jiangella anatolica]|uniref:Enolase n=1 Tax=Jiangella anatolica TaxID=2670374 RepID=A0A2W2CD85_9ACTN|nr:phosphopyruvate hydratase [Jiangella anatolica]PZF86277.1 phosphopyruvate hydratase [Jiangella anatolica]